jgi:RimJ/RimL family protein N-acetyltransferase
MMMAWANEEPRTKYQLAIVQAGIVIGNCGIRLASGGDSKAEFGCELAPRVWRNGYATEVGHAMLAFAFRTLRVHRVFSETTSENAAAIAIAERLGMKRENGPHAQQCIKGRWVDTLVLGILASEWSDRS